MSEVYIFFSAGITPVTTQALMAVMVDQATKGTQKINLMMSTRGGNVSEGITLYNVLRAMPFKLITHNMGNIDSVGNPIFLAGEERYACPHSTFMFHGVGIEIQAPIRLEDSRLKELTDAIDADNAKTGSIIKERAPGISDDDLAALFKKAVTKDATWAKSVGIINEIRPANLPNGAAAISLAFQ